MQGSDVPLVRLAEGLQFAECPRWYRNRLWFSDIFARRVIAMDEDGHMEVIAQLEDDLPTGLGFLPDGTPLVVSMSRPVILALDRRGRPRVHADLSALAVGALNDMVVDDVGRAYVGSMGSHNSLEPRPLDGDGNIILVNPDGSARIVAEGLDAPNGPCLLPEGSTYVVAEFPAQRLAAFDRTETGELVNGRVWADLKPGSADGIAVDSNGDVWTASPRTHECRLVREGGEVVARIPTGDALPLACALGGATGRTLFIMNALGGEEAIQNRNNTSAIDAILVQTGAW